MATTVKQTVGTPVDKTPSGFSTLASATFIATTAINNTTNQPLDILVDVSATPGSTPTGNKQIIVYAIASLTGANGTYQAGPTSGTSATDEPSLTLLGVVPVSTSGVPGRKMFPVSLQYGGDLPPYVMVVLKNDCGVSLSAGAVQVAEVTTTAA